MGSTALLLLRGFSPMQIHGRLPQCPELKPDVTPVLQPLRSDHDLMAPLNPEDRQTGTSHHITQSLADPPSFSQATPVALQ
ncbi:hypothetical protein HGM15179_014262 [Zosterops borbonicus]|uniref:Uncharacterized protein n=1 Tax=Zosterops borbonicus TaxID=364589 RepID=A0A8K1G7G1_9PASS|nr:hypothetical protein HGM15179_014262 [Zosterops borbonicus]